MKLIPFPNCCTGRIASQFGGPTSDYFGQTPTKEEIVTFLEDSLRKVKQAGEAFVCVVTNDAFPPVMEALEELDFQRSEWMGKRKHSETKVAIWWKGVEDIETSKVS